MACDAPTLLGEACDNGWLVLAANETVSRGVILQLFYLASNSTDTEDELLSQACSNGFMQVAQNESLFRAILLQLFCDTTGG